MAIIITRETGPTAKGSPLTNAEVDNNFINLNAELGTSIQQSSIGSAPNQIPLNQFLGDLAYQDAADIAGNMGVGGSVKAAQLVLPTNTTDAIFTKDDNLTAWEYSGKSFSVTAQETAPSGIYFSPDGLRMYVIGSTGDDVNQYSLSTPWDVTTSTFVRVSAVLSETAPTGVFFKPDGTQMYVVGSTNDTIQQYSLSTAWDVSTLVVGLSLLVSAQDTVPQDIWFRADGLKMYMVGSTNDRVYEYNLGTAWAVNTATFVQFFSVAAQELTPVSIDFASDGTRMYVLGASGLDISRYTLTTPWNISTAVYYNNFYIGFQETAPAGMFIDRSNGVAYVVGSTADVVFQYATETDGIELVSSSGLFIHGSLYTNKNLVVTADSRIDGSLRVSGPVFGSSFTGAVSATTISASSTLTLGSATTSANVIGTTVTTGSTTIGGTTQTGLLVFGQSTATSTTEVAKGATLSGSTKTVNIGTGGVSGSTTNINIGSTVAGSTTTTSVAGAANIGTNLANYLTVTGATTGNVVSITTAGSDANIGLTIATKGTGSIILDTGTSTGNVEIKPGASNLLLWDDNSSHYYRFVTGDVTANYDITLPAGSVTLTAGTTVVDTRSINTTAPLSGGGNLSADRTLSLAAGYGDTLNPFGNKTANFFLAAPNGAAGVPTFRAIVAADIPTLNQSTTGSAATLTTGRTIAMTGDVAWTSASFNGSANVTGTATLSSVGTAGTYTKVTTDTKGRVTSGTTLAATDIPSLDAAKITSGTIDAARLPSYVDDVLEFANLGVFPATGETGKIYIAIDTNKTYRWSGSVYTFITSGAVDSVAGKTGVVTLVKSDVGLSNVDNTADSSKSVSSAATLTTARTINGVSFNGSANITISANTTNALTIGTGLSGTSYNGSSAVTIAIDSTVTTLTGTQTLTNKTLTSPRVGTAILDTNGNELIGFTATTAAVNELLVSNAATGGSVLLTTAGGDANINLLIQTKGTGSITLDTGTGAGFVDIKPGLDSLRLYDDDSSHYYRFVTGNIAANYDITLPAGNVTLTAGTSVVTTRSISTNNGLTGGGDLSADRTLGLTGQALALHNLATNGIIARTNAGTVAARTITAGTGISITNGDGVSGNPTVTNSAPDQTVVLTASTGISISGTYPSFTISSTNSLYSAGNGIGLSGTTFSVAAGDGLTQETSGLAVNNTVVRTSGIQAIAGAKDFTDAPSITSTRAQSWGGLASNLLIKDSAAPAANVGGTLSFGNATFGTGGIGAFTEGTAQASYLALYYRPTSGNIVEGLRINSAGNVGIGTTAPVARLHVNAPSTTNVSLTWNAAAGQIFRNENSELAIGLEDTTPFNMFIQGRTNANTARAIVINPLGGNVGIGTPSPSYTLEVNGSFAATTKSFVIDHPTKPGKKLRYGSLEGPENGVYVRGKTQTNIIELPEYWAVLVDPDSITVQLTPIGRHQKLYVEKIEGSKVHIASDNMLNTSINCFYYILAERADVEKLEVEIG